MEWAIWWFALSLIAGAIASGKGRSGLGFFLLAQNVEHGGDRKSESRSHHSTLNEIGILAAAVASPNVAHLEGERLDSGEMRKCPDCAELVRSEAKKCRYCGAALAPIGSSAALAEPGVRGNAGYRIGKAIGSAFKTGQQSGKQPKA